MARSTTLSAFALLAGLATGPAWAQAPSDLARPAILGGNVAGGGIASLAGGGLDRQITYSRRGAGGGASFERPGRIASFAGNSGGSPYWTYGAASEAAPGREAWMVGGGEDIGVVYADPARGR
ncbi:hypothetical protein [Roseicella aquatilis]|uniref:Uncharacterized protein n=1 Tax=Roseicella aquatilis TaxID=2527868 RepID=A0A4R4DV98_9PROT|nr:hypothetical protein [Roseicella aquatilis]TCZ64370.1 hypothetical protein EXY23_06905 [Roseicella aquatilis]